MIEGNTFRDNDDGITFYEAHDLPRASLFMARGGKNFLIENNVITHMPLDYYGGAIVALKNYYNWLPRNYWMSLHSPLFRLDIPHGE